MATTPSKISVSVASLASHIDHSLLHPTLTTAQVEQGLEVARRQRVVAACVRPCDVALAARLLAGPSPAVRVCTVVGFPHGSSTTQAKVSETMIALRDGAVEIDVVVNIGLVRAEDWRAVGAELRLLNDVVRGFPAAAGPALLKVIFENAYLDAAQIRRLAELCRDLDIAYVKTSTGYGFVPRDGGGMVAVGARMEDLEIMLDAVKGSRTKVKAAGGIKTLDDLIKVIAMGVDRVGMTSTAQVLDEARARGIAEDDLVEVEVKHGDAGAAKEGY